MSSLTIEQQETESRELKVKVHVDESRVQDAIHDLAQKQAKKLRIPGFRPGKAPFHVVQNWVGKQALRAEAVENLSQEIYQEVLAELDIDP